MMTFIFSFLTLLAIITVIVFYIMYLNEILKSKFISKWYGILAYVLITFIPVIGLLIYKFWRKKILVD